jgi:UDP-N-acetylglucosamine 1-carboxyvinyltransferase
MADGETEITGVQYIDRGYDHIEDKLKLLGADIRREKVEEIKDFDFFTNT